MTTAVVGAPGSARRYLHSLWLLSARDLKVRYSTSALGYLWSILDPLVMSAIYWFVFTLIFQRDGIGGEPYIVFLLVGLQLPGILEDQQRTTGELIALGAVASGGRYDGLVGRFRPEPVPATDTERSLPWSGRRRRPLVGVCAG